VYLPSYSPDYNPIELAFSKMKAGVKREGEMAQVALEGNDDDAEASAHALLFKHIFSVTESDARGWY
ncbi:hypothetical protein BDV93DRAFT_405958, partial [Ceratobasidium sp. AG-I]